MFLIQVVVCHSLGGNDNASNPSDKGIDLNETNSTDTRQLIVRIRTMLTKIGLIIALLADTFISYLFQRKRDRDIDTGFDRDFFSEGRFKGPVFDSEDSSFIQSAFAFEQGL